MEINPVFDGITGEIKLWSIATPPPGWLICDGTAISRTTYATLFSVIGTTFGAGNGTTTFNIPLSTDRFPIGAGAVEPIGHNGTSTLNHKHSMPSINTDTGYANGTDSGHTHTISQGTNVVIYAGSDQVVSYIASSTDSGSANWTDSGHAHSMGYLVETGETTISPAFFSIYFIIKY